MPRRAEGQITSFAGQLPAQNRGAALADPLFGINPP